MNLDKDKFEELLELYPQTKENLRLRALEKRSIFMYYKNKVEEKAKAARLGYGRISSASPINEERNDDLLYKSTYSGREDDSDKDEYHITMPFKHNDEIHHKILREPQFESDESF